jgi:hypothetical protein
VGASSFFSDGKKFNEAILRLYSRTSPQDFPALVLESFGRLFSNICVSFDEIDGRTGFVRNAIDKPLPISREHFIEGSKQWSAEHPSVNYRKRGGNRNILQISDFLTEREFFETAFYQDFFRLMGIRHQLSAVIPDPECIVAVSINRDSIFTTQEVELMRLLQTHLVRAYQIVKNLAFINAASVVIDSEESNEEKTARGEIKVLDGAWKGNVITGRIWK